MDRITGYIVNFVVLWFYIIFQSALLWGGLKEIWSLNTRLKRSFDFALLSPVSFKPTALATLSSNVTVPWLHLEVCFYTPTARWDFLTVTWIQPFVFISITQLPHYGCWLVFILDIKQRKMAAPRPRCYDCHLELNSPLCLSYPPLGLML